jgi:UDP:flavonoid glycosyltransferase YjiC (YdhE family)
MTRQRYLFALIDGGGNVPAELHAARRLVARGHAATVLADDSVMEEVRATGADARRWLRAPNRKDRRPEHDLARDWECKYPWQLVDRVARTMIVGPAADYAQDINEAIAEQRPDVVICSMFCLGGMIAAEAAGIPFVTLFPNVYPLPADGLPPFGIGLRPASGSLGRLRDRVLNRVIEHLWDAAGLSHLNALRRQYGLAPVSHVLDQMRIARRQLVQTSPDFDFPAFLPAAVRYVGPVLDDPVWAETRWMPPAGDAPLVLIAMSTTFQNQIGCLQRVLNALGTLAVRGIMTTGPALDAVALEPPANVTILERAPHKQVLRHAALVVTHGGHGTVMKALAAGVPMLLLPHGRDQADTATRVTMRGAGIALKRTAPSRTIAAAARHVLQNASYRAAAQRLGEIIRRDAGTDTLVRELESIAVGADPRLSAAAQPETRRLAR